ncbi:hypothetical protein H009_25330 [Agrobacterium tumefaciens str. Cherry 2E-2-2]|nr:hypothetical protein H009_25330 [Agrobacterium tumefaciens str. Cherry 2E-2-2]
MPLIICKNKKITLFANIYCVFIVYAFHFIFKAALDRLPNFTTFVDVTTNSISIAKGFPFGPVLFVEWPQIRQESIKIERFNLDSTLFRPWPPAMFDESFPIHISFGNIQLATTR